MPQIPRLAIYKSTQKTSAPPPLTLWALSDMEEASAAPPRDRRGEGAEPFGVEVPAWGVPLSCPGLTPCEHA
eukprot:scaffold98196_cov18-Tisochrysis_lutea.AAC.1